MSTSSSSASSEDEAAGGPPPPPPPAPAPPPPAPVKAKKAGSGGGGGGGAAAAAAAAAAGRGGAGPSADKAKNVDEAGSWTKVASMSDEDQAFRVTLPGAAAGGGGGGSDSSSLRVVVISDTHNEPERIALPKGDVLLHCGDWTHWSKWRKWRDRHRGKGRGPPSLYHDEADPADAKSVANSGKGVSSSLEKELPPEVEAFNEWLGTLRDRFQAIVVIAGNHDLLHGFPRDRARAILSNATHYLVDETVEVLGGLRIHGSPWTGGSMAFGMRQADRAAKWALIPDGVDIVMTHEPPFNTLDLAFVGAKEKSMAPCDTCGERHRGYRHWGCPLLRETLLDRVKPTVHCYGHVHDCPGAVRSTPRPGETHGVTFVNAATDMKTTAYFFDIVPRSKQQQQLPPGAGKAEEDDASSDDASAAAAAAAAAAAGAGDKKKSKKKKGGSSHQKGSKKSKSSKKSKK